MLGNNTQNEFLAMTDKANSNQIKRHVVSEKARKFLQPNDRLLKQPVSACIRRHHAFRIHHAPTIYVITTEIGASSPGEGEVGGGGGHMQKEFPSVGSRLPYVKVGNARQKICIKPLEGTDLDIVRALFDP